MALPVELWDTVQKQILTLCKQQVLQELMRNVTSDTSPTLRKIHHTESGDWIRKKANDLERQKVNWGHVVASYQEYACESYTDSVSKDHYYLIRNGVYTRGNRLMDTDLNMFYLGGYVISWKRGERRQNFLKGGMFWFQNGDDLYIHQDFFKIWTVRPEQYFKKATAREEIGDTVLYKGVGDKSSSKYLMITNLGVGYE